MILVDLETGSFEVESGIFEVALMVIKNNEVVERLHLGDIANESLIPYGMGSGYNECSYNKKFIEAFKNIINKYNYPLVAHNGAFDRKFLTYYEWISEDYPFYDSIRAFRLSQPRLFSYSMEYLIDFLNLHKKYTHTAMEDVETLWEVINTIKATIWVPIGENLKRKNSSKGLDSLNKDFDVIKDIFNEKTIVFTGKGPYTRNNLIELAKKCGANAENSVTKRTDILVVGEDAGSKLQKAKDLGIEIISMSDFFEMVSEIDIDISKTDKIKTETNNDKVNIIKSDKLKGQVISLIPMKVALASRVARVIESHGGIALGTFRKNETTRLVYQTYGEDFATVEKAKKNNIPIMTLGKFNRFILDLEAGGDLV